MYSLRACYVLDWAISYLDMSIIVILFLRFHVNARKRLLLQAAGGDVIVLMNDVLIGHRSVGLELGIWLI